MNRQERRRIEREKGKDQNKEIHEIQKDFEILKTLPMKQLTSVNRIITKSTDIARKEFMQSLDRNLTAALIENGFTIKQIRVIQDRTYYLSEEDSIKLEKLEKENVDMAKLQVEVKEYIKELIGQGKGRTEVVEETLFKFPKLSKTMINNAFGKMQEEKEIEDAANYILEDNKNVKKAIEKEDAKKIAAEVARQIEKEERIVEGGQMIGENKNNIYLADNGILIPGIKLNADCIITGEMTIEDKESDELEVLEEVVIKEVKLKGKNGVYEAKTGVGVALENDGYKLAFKDIAELESFYGEFKKVFGRI
ncbi:MAG: hypothetical protein E7J31_09775 [Clostridium sp.]|uniref:hypothetical protein n=1 Tax=Clostridium sp. TaxID=1506 RepID=UPI0029140471|nr:hypothetical protein [Clostridium sp.]MDU7948717.1 hypothetical protein [Clostridium sp.]